MHVCTSNGPLYVKHGDRNYMMMRNKSEIMDGIGTWELELMAEMEVKDVAKLSCCYSRLSLWCRLPCIPSMPGIYRPSRGGTSTCPVYLHRPFIKHIDSRYANISAASHQYKKGNIYWYILLYLLWLMINILSILLEIANRYMAYKVCWLWQHIRSQCIYVYLSGCVVVAGYQNESKYDLMFCYQQR
jgi:hypothetical protein